MDILPTLLDYLQIPIDETLDGQSRWNQRLMTSNGGNRKRPRFWETYQPGLGTLSFSLLSADGRWRLSSMYGWPPALFDLRLDPGGHQDVSAEHPDRVKAMQTLYLNTRVPLARLPLRELLGMPRRLTGFDQMRSPDEYGQTVLFELISSESNADARLIRQPDDWSMGSTGDSRIKLDSRLGSVVSLGAPTGDCSVVALVLEQRRAGLLGLRKGASVLRLFLDGALQATLDFDGELPRKAAWPATEILSEQVGEVRFFNGVAFGSSDQLPYHHNARLRNKLPSPVPIERLTYPRLDALSHGLCL